VARGPTVSRLVQALGGNWEKTRESEEWDKALQYLGKTAAIIQAPTHTHTHTHTHAYVQSPSAEFSHAFWVIEQAYHQHRDRMRGHFSVRIARLMLLHTRQTLITWWHVQRQRSLLL
jgi:hypothetical protein